MGFFAYIENATNLRKAEHRDAADIWRTVLESSCLFAHPTDYFTTHNATRYELMEFLTPSTLQNLITNLWFHMSPMVTRLDRTHKISPSVLSPLISSTKTKISISLFKHQTLFLKHIRSKHNFHRQETRELSSFQHSRFKLPNKETRVIAIAFEQTEQSITLQIYRMKFFCGPVTQADWFPLRNPPPRPSSSHKKLEEIVLEPQKAPRLSQACFTHGKMFEESQGLAQVTKDWCTWDPDESQHGDKSLKVWASRNH